MSDLRKLSLRAVRSLYWDLRYWWRRPYRRWRLELLTTAPLVCRFRGHQWVDCEIAIFCNRCMKEPFEIPVLQQYHQYLKEREKQQKAYREARVG